MRAALIALSLVVLSGASALAQATSTAKATATWDRNLVIF